jgi:hypothetical protein
VSAKTPLTALNVVRIPASFNADEISRLKAENVGSGFVQIIPGTESAKGVEAATPQALSLWGQLAEGILEEGATLLVPGPWLAWVDLVIEKGVPVIESLFTKNPTVERWTLAALKEQAASIANVVPST